MWKIPRLPADYKLTNGETTSTDAEFVAYGLTFNRPGRVVGVLSGTPATFVLGDKDYWLRVISYRWQYEREQYEEFYRNLLRVEDAKREAV